MMAAFHMRMGFARFGQWINAIDNRLHRRANMRPKGFIDGLGKAGFLGQRRARKVEPVKVSRFNMTGRKFTSAEKPCI